MKTLIFLIVILLYPAISSSQELYEIIDYHFDAVNQDKFNKIPAVLMTYNIENGGKPGKMIVHKKRNNKLRIERIVNDDTIITVFNDGEAYRKTGFGSAVEKINDWEFEELKFAADMEGYFFCYREKEHNLELIGKEKIGNRTVFEINCVKPGGYESILFMDAEKYLLLETIHRFPEGDNVIEKHTRFDDYRKIGDIPFPFKETITFNNKTETRILTDIRLDIIPDDSLFILN